MPKMAWKNSAAWVALPTAHTTASQPGHRERVASVVVLDQPDELAQLVQVELGQPLLVGQGLLDGHVLQDSR